MTIIGPWSVIYYVHVAWLQSCTAVRLISSQQTSDAHRTTIQQYITSVIFMCDMCNIKANYYIHPLVAKCFKHLMHVAFSCGLRKTTILMHYSIVLLFAFSYWWYFIIIYIVYRMYNNKGDIACKWPLVCNLHMTSHQSFYGCIL